MITFRYRTLMVFAAGFAVALIGVFAFQSWRADAAPGDNDTTFIPITPCRLIDTRPTPDRVGPHDTFRADDTKTVAATGTNGNCTIPADAVGLSLNVTAVDATAPTFLTIWPSGTLPTASSLNPFPGQPPTPNAVTTNLKGMLGFASTFNIYNLAGSVNVIVDINGYYTKTSLQELNNRIGALETLTASMSNETVDAQPTVRFTGVNVQIVDGTGDTDGAVNGKGNLIVGYNENFLDTRTGSHNLIVGDRHSYTSYGGLVAGYDSTVTGTYASVSGGLSNTASGKYTSVTGGQLNTASAASASVSGGSGNTASEIFASVSGGLSNSASGRSASVSGGSGNTASGSEASVSGGLGNTATTAYESVVGGDNVFCSSILNNNYFCGEGSITPID